MSLNVSAFTQLQNWSAGQAAINKQIFGNRDAASTADYSAAFANAQSNLSFQQGSLAVTAMELRQVHQAQSVAAGHASGTTAKAKSASGKTVADPALTAAKAAGNDILTSLGLRSNPPKNTKPSSSSGPYVPPLNPATGHAYVATSAATSGELGALNLLV